MGLRVLFCPRENPGQPRSRSHRVAGPMNQALRFERLKEFNHIGKKLGSGNREVLSQIVCDLINGVMRFQAVPKSSIRRD